MAEHGCLKIRRQHVQLTPREPPEPSLYFMIVAGTWLDEYPADSFWHPSEALGQYQGCYRDWTVDELTDITRLQDHCHERLDTAIADLKEQSLQGTDANATCHRRRKGQPLLRG